MTKNFHDYCQGTAVPPVRGQRRIGGASDSHGCITAAGYSWCEVEGKCVKPWELATTKQFENTPGAFQTYCNGPLAGQIGPDGCIGSAGYTWCAKDNMCVRPWVLAQSKGFENTVDGFAQYCSS